MTNSDITHLTQAIMELKGQIERMSERQEEMVEDVKKIKRRCTIRMKVCMLVSGWNNGRITSKSTVDYNNNYNWFSCSSTV